VAASRDRRKIVDTADQFLTSECLEEAEAECRAPDAPAGKGDTHGWRVRFELILFSSFTNRRELGGTQLRRAGFIKMIGPGESHRRKTEWAGLVVEAAIARLDTARKITGCR